MKVTLKILLTLAVLLLTYMCVRSVMNNTEFEKEQILREDAIKARLIEIRKVQIEYKNVHKVHAASFDQLEKFLNEEKIPFLVKEGVLTDEQLEKGMTERKAIDIINRAKRTGRWDEVEKNGLTDFKRDTTWIIAKDTLLGQSYNVTDMRYVPTIPGDRLEFTMDTATLTSGSGYEIKVFACEVPYEEYLRNMYPQLRFNLIDKASKQGKYPGLRVGSLEEINNNAGNWE